MKILAIGDFHGKLSKKFKSIIKKENIDLVVSVGDFFPFVQRKIWFKHCYGTDITLWEAIGKKETRKWIEKDLAFGEKVFKKLNSLPVPVFTIVGNLDYSDQVVDSWDPEKGKKGKKWAWYDQDFFSKIVKKYKNISRFDYGYIKFGDYVFIGAYGGTSPGKVRSKNFKKYRAKLDKLFRKFRKENKEGKVVFVSHNVPNNTKLDKVSMKAHKAVRGKHYGSKLVKRTITKNKPVLAIGGHIHEGFGKDKIKNTVIINSGSAAQGQGVIIDLPENKKKKVKVKFIR